MSYAVQRSGIGFQWVTLEFASTLEGAKKALARQARVHKAASLQIVDENGKRVGKARLRRHNWKGA